jgi:hypothetical protein
MYDDSEGNSTKPVPKTVLKGELGEYYEGNHGGFF